MLQRRVRPRVVVVLVLTDLAFAFQQTAIMPAVKDVRQAFDSPREWSAWLVTVYLIVATVATPAFGRLGDLYGRRRVLLLGLGIVLVGCIGAATAPNMAVLLLWRAVQGVGGSVYPLTLALGRDELPEGRFRGSVALFAAAFGAGTALGFVAGGALAEYASWRYGFVVGAVLVLAAWVAVRTLLPAASDRAAGAYDWPGTALLSVSVAALLVALTYVARHGWNSPVVITLLALLVGAAPLWARVELRRGDPLVDLRALTTGRALVANTSSLALGWALFSAYLLLPEFARAHRASVGYGFGVKAAAVGVMLLPLAIGQAGGALAAAPLARAVGTRSAPMVAQLTVAAGFLVLAVSSHALAGFVAGTLVLGIGAGAALASSSASATTGVDEQEAGASAADASALRRLGGGIGGQVAMIALASVSIGSTGKPAGWTFTVGFAIAAGFCALGAAVLNAERLAKAGG